MLVPYSSRRAKWYKLFFNEMSSLVNVNQSMAKGPQLFQPVQLQANLSLVFGGVCSFYFVASKMFTYRTIGDIVEHVFVRDTFWLAN